MKREKHIFILLVTVARTLHEGIYCGPLCVIVALSVALFCPFSVSAQDTISVRTLTPVSIGASRPVTTTTQAPTQVLSVEKLSSSVQLSDAVKQLGGVTLKDYGGIGGIKTISARGLGSQFSVLTIDGVAVNDCQNGQIDLGRYLLGNTDYVSFANGHFGGLLQSARSFAAGNVLNLQTQQPRFWSRRYNLKISMEGGSFGYISPSLLWEQRVGRNLSLSLWANYMQSEGNYPFTLYYTNGRSDSSSREYRQNSQVYMSTVDANLFWSPSSRQQITTKLHYAGSYHALPGPVTYYNVKGSEHTTSQVFFIQTQYRSILSERWRLQALGKYSHNGDVYEDTAANNGTLTLHNEYLQQEGYLSATVVYQPWQHTEFSLANDGALTTLESNLAQNSMVSRLSWTGVAAGSYTRQRFSLSANLLSTIIDESTNSDITHQYQKISPYVGASLQLLPFRRIDTSAIFAQQQEKESYHTLRLRYFFKENYRVPNFNEMYYFTITRDLKPEKAIQHNVGFTYASFFPIDTANATSGSVTATLDGYYNRVNDKIIAIPTQNLFLWSMTNLGCVGILGVDFTSDVSCSFSDIVITASVNYSYQRALDVTNSTSKTYRQQIPYTPRHSGGGTLYFESPYVNAGYTIVWVGDRYRLGQNTPNNLVAAYVDQGITLSKEIKLSSGALKLKAQVLNLFDVQYEVVKNYPMMGRNYRLALTYIF